MFSAVKNVFSASSGDGQVDNASALPTATKKSSLWPTPREPSKAALQSLSLNQITTISCSACPHPCADGTEGSSGEDEEGMRRWAKMGVDMSSEMMGSVKPYRRHVVISTGKRDWVREVTEEKGSLAKAINGASEKLGRKGFDTEKAKGAEGEEGRPALPPGCFASSSSAATTRLTINNGSNISSSSSASRQSILVFPDYIALNEVPNRSDETEAGALYESYLAFDAPRPGALKTLKDIGERDGGAKVRAQPLPYFATVLLCSHKKRDVKCHIAAPLLSESLQRCAEREGWEVDTRGDDLGDIPDLDDNAGEDDVEPEEAVARRTEVLRTNLRQAAAGFDGVKNLGVFFVSHVGGHKFAGNMIIYFPNGAGVWYGRVTPRDVPLIVEQTLKQGKIIPEFLRGGVNLVRDDIAGGGEGGGDGILKW